MRKARPMSIDENKKLVRRWFVELDRRNLDAVDDFIAEDYVDYNPPIPDLKPGREGVREANRLLYAAFENVEHAIQDQIAEGDKVMTRVVTRGRFVGEFLGFPPTGEVVELEGTSVHRISDGRLVEHWATADTTKFMAQVGAGVPASAERPA